MSDFAPSWSLANATPRDLAAAAYFQADMTLGQAMETLTLQGWACACIGAPWVERNGQLRPPPRDTPCSCHLTVLQVQRLQRAAHIVAKLLAEVAQRRENREQS